MLKVYPEKIRVGRLLVNLVFSIPPAEPVVIFNQVHMVAPPTFTGYLRSLILLLYYWYSSIRGSCDKDEDPVVSYDYHAHIA